MTTKELRELLLRLDPEEKLEVICRRHSDYQSLDDDGEQAVSVVEGVKKPSAGYIMRSHRDMSEEEKRSARLFVCFKGN